MAKTRINLSKTDREILWSRWRSGESLSDIGRTLKRHPATIYAILLKNGGFTPNDRVRSERNLSLFEREDILLGIALGQSFRRIAIKLGRSPSTVSREVNNNGGRGKYRATVAEKRALDKAKRPKSCLLSTHVLLRDIVAEKLKNNWSPQQISGWLKLTYKSNKTMHISHETIYRSLFIQARGVLKKELLKHLRTNRVIRQSRYNNSKGSPRGQIIDAVSISERPPEIEEEPGMEGSSQSEGIGYAQRDWNVETRQG